MQVRVHDLQGRLVRRLPDGVATAEGLELVWDGREERGGVAGAGVYWVQVEGAWGVTSRRFVLVR